jgi:quercetin dioxygenase-like cupin family protein
MNYFNPALGPTIEMVYSETKEPLEMTNHFHNSYEILYISSGKASLKINDKQYTIKKGSLVFISNRESHELKALEFPYVRSYILIKPSFLQAVIDDPVLSSIFKQRPVNFNHTISLDKNENSYVDDIICNIYAELQSRQVYWEENTGAYLKQLFIYLYRQRRDHFPLTELNDSIRLVTEIQNYIDEHRTEDLNPVTFLNRCDR